MDGMLVKIVVAGVVGAHGIGHALGWLPALGVARFAGTSGGSWLLDGLVGEGAARVAAAAVFLAPTAGFVVAAAGLLLGQPWWRPVAAASAAVSLAGTALYPGAFPTGSTIGAVAVNVVVLYAVVIAGWGADAASA